MPRNLLSSPRFHAIRYLGHGATSRVFEVVDRANGGCFALKQLRRERLSVERIARFKDEFRALERISHPNVAKVYELLADETGVYLLMELVKGHDFINYVRIGASSHVHTLSTASLVDTADQRVAARWLPGRTGGGRLSVERLRDALVQLVSGVRALHAAGSIHSDIKPANVLVNYDGRVVIVDFGLLTAAVRGNRFRGTPAFMAPEQFEGVHTEATDWYAVGMLLYAALCERFSVGGSPSAIARTRLSRRPPDPRLQVRGLPNDLVELALRMLEPDPARRPAGDVIARLVGVDESSSRIHRPRLDFLGRGAELERLGAAFTSVRQSRARVVHVHGESGIGKTSLLRRFAAMIEERGGIVLRGACYRDASVPYKALDAIMDRIAVSSANVELSADAEDRAALALMFPVFCPEEGPELGLAGRDPLLIRARAVAAFRKLLAQLAERHGVVLCIDDMQWTDLESIELLSSLLHPPALPGLLLVLGYRSAHEDWGPRVEVLRKELPPDDDLPLGPLDVQAVRALVETSAVVSQAELEAIWRESGGNPFFVGELVRGRSAGYKAISFGAALASRMSALSPKYLPYLELVCVASRPVDEQVLRRALGVTQETLLEARWVLVADSLVRVAEEKEGRSVEPYHDRIREHLLYGLEPERLHARHSALAEAYEAEVAADPEILGFHYRAAGNAVKALTYTERAADAAARALAFDRAADLYDAALRFAEGDARVALLVKLGNALANAGRSVEAARTFGAALEHAEKPPEPKLPVSEGDRKAGSMGRGLTFFAEQIAVRASEAWLLSGHVEEGLAVLAPVLKQRGMPVRRGARAALAIARELLWLLGAKLDRLPTTGAGGAEDREAELEADIGWSVAKGLLYVSPIEGTDFLLRSLAAALRAGCPERTARALGFLGACMFMQVPLLEKKGEQCLRRASEIADALGDPYLLAMREIWLGFVEMYAGRWTSMLQRAQRGLAILQARCVGVAWEAVIAQGLCAWAQQFRGDLGASSSCAGEGLSWALRRGDLFAEVMFSHYLAYAELGCGDLALVRRRVLAVESRWRPPSYTVQHFYSTYLLAMAELSERRPDLAARRLAQSRKPFIRAGGMRAAVSRIDYTLLEARIQLSVGRRERPEGSLRPLEAIAKRFENEVRADAAGHTAFVRAATAARGQRREVASQQWDRAAHHYEKSGMGLHAACARFRRAELVNAGAQRDAALSAIRDCGVQEPERWLRMFMPSGLGS